MGFEDVKADGLSIEELKEETKKYNKLYFGEGVALYNTPTKKGQLEKYTEAKKRYIGQQFAPVKEYFLSLGWDYTEKNGVHNFRANAKVCVSYGSDENCFIQFKNGDTHKTYDIRIKSDFRENPYYVLNTHSKGWGSDRYIAKGGEATQPEMIKERLDEIKDVIDYNESLKGGYNFKITVDKNADNYNRYENDIDWIEYGAVMDIINEISKEYF